MNQKPRLGLVKQIWSICDADKRAVLMIFNEPTFAKEIRYNYVHFFEEVDEFFRVSSRG